VSQPPQLTVESRASSGSSATLALDERPLLRGWLHVVAGLGIAVAGPLLIAAARNGVERVAYTVYTFGLLMLFGVSSLFHRGRWSPAAARRWRRADHSTIFLGIAGTYTAVACTSLHGVPEVVILAVVWGGAAAGVLLRQILLDAPQWVVALPYVVVGWCALGVVPELVAGLGGGGFAVLLAGGLAYTAGAIVYASKRPDPAPRVFGFHEIFHACTVIGAVLQYVAVAGFALPRSS
jgi:hemolysin III